ncbi:transcriptional regulator GutM [Sporanaerobacter acetigenes]|uniref:transcriptional regulator GutM n=1 Tax=Sporanaerobacter acetigenes TaxID=165813 RepID=UPI0010484069|nr:transcriptional regulator GutM [Sporanaerobacter acetigenes]
MRKISDLLKIMIFIFGMWMLQGILAYFQIKHFRKVVNEMKKQGKVLIGQQKGKLSAGSIVVLAIDKHNKVINVQEMRGITVFDKFRVKDEFINKSIDELKRELPNMKNKKSSLALKKAIEQL